MIPRSLRRPGRAIKTGHWRGTDFAKGLNSLKDMKLSPSLRFAGLAIFTQT